MGDDSVVARFATDVRKVRPLSLKSAPHFADLGLDLRFRRNANGLELAPVRWGTQHELHDLPPTTRKLLSSRGPVRFSIVSSQ